MKVNRNSRFAPLIIGVSMVIGVLIGTFVTLRFGDNKINIITSSNKLSDLLHIVEQLYVDTVDVDAIVEDAMPKIIEELDPHSRYIPAKDAVAANEDLKGSFSGVGVQFTIKDDTVHITNIIKGGPSEKVGLLAGDRIIAIDDSSYVGKGIVSNEETMHRLKGEKGTNVKIGVMRGVDKDTLSFVVCRGDIPLKSIDATYMLNKELGYIKIEKFAETTYSEMLVSLAELQEQGFKGLVVDLRGNGGGYLSAAINMVNEFLPEKKLIVYTDGRTVRREEYRSDGRGSYQNLPLIVLVDETSASASEIFSGAIQDNDRGMIIGRRTFGKGLVQQPIDFSDGSMIYITVARYYTPSGRCIQKPYTRGEGDEYNKDIITRYEHGEFFNQDSIKQSGETYTTSIGRIVYGGGGIMPDYFVAEDTSDFTSYYKEVVIKGLIPQFCFDYTDRHRTQLKEFDTAADIEKYLRRNNVVEQFIHFADSKKVKRRNLMIKQSRKLFERNIYGSIIYYMLDMNDYVKYINSDDPTIIKAVQLFNNGETKPELPSEASE